MIDDPEILERCYQYWYINLLCAVSIVATRRSDICQHSSRRVLFLPFICLDLESIRRLACEMLSVEQHLRDKMSTMKSISFPRRSSVPTDKIATLSETLNSSIRTFVDSPIYQLQVLQCSLWYEVSGGEKLVRVNCDRVSFSNALPCKINILSQYRCVDCGLVSLTVLFNVWLLF